MAQLELPFEGTTDYRGDLFSGILNEVRQALPGGFNWMPGNTIIPGQPFVVWATPEHPDDFEEIRVNVENVFNTYQNLVKLWPWCGTSYHYDPDTGASAIIGLPFRSPQEMVVNSVAPIVYDALSRLVYTMVSSIGPVSEDDINFPSDQHSDTRSLAR